MCTHIAGPGAAILADDPDAAVLLSGQTYSDNVLNNAVVPGGRVATITSFTVAGSNQKLTPGSGPVILRDPVSGVVVGTIVLQANGKYTFASSAAYAGPVPVITVSVSNGAGQTVMSTLTLDVLPSKYMLHKTLYTFCQHGLRAASSDGWVASHG